MATQNLKDVDGIGITRFFQGKDLLITGATGFLAKVLVEKILREVPDVGKIYLVMRASNSGAAMQRLKSEMISTELFKLLQQKYGDSYDAFMLTKLVPVTGNMCDSYLGIEPDLASHISNKVHVIIGAAANISFNERYDVSTKTNVIGPYNLIMFAKRCKQLKLFLHVSSVHVNGEREGNIMEKAFRMGDSIAREKYFQGQQYSTPTCSSQVPPILDVGHELQLAIEAFSNGSSIKEMKELAMKRAKKFGWYNGYQITKAMGEMVIDSVREDIPVVIVRPSGIESSLNDPFPGWIQGNKVLDPLIINYGMGKLSGFVVDPTTVFDIIPVDMVANVILAAIAKHGSMLHELGEDIKVYHVGTSTLNPIKIQDIFRMLYEHFHSYPYIEPANGIAIKVSPLQIFDSLEGFSNALRTHIALQPNTNMSDEMEITLNKSVNRLENMAEVYMPYSFYRGRFDITNMEKLMKEMSAEEKNKYNIDVRTIDWKHYFKNVHIPGVRRHIMMEVTVESKM